jgi:hypothetical protein
MGRRGTTTPFLNCEMPIEHATQVRPSGDAPWETRRTGIASGRPLDLQLLPGRTGDEPVRPDRPTVYYCLPARPQLRTQGGRPVFSLTLILGRQPRSGEDTVYPLIERGVLTCDVLFTVPIEAIAELKQRRPAEYRPLFLRDSTIELATTAGESLASLPISGDGARGSLSAALTRQQTLGVLAALDHAASDLVVRASVRFSAIQSARTVRMRGSWSQIHDWLHARWPTAGFLSGVDLRTAFEDMVESDVIKVSITGRGVEQAVRAPDAAQFAMFRSMVSVVLERVTPQLELEDSDNRYSLRRKPSSYFLLDASQTLAGDDVRAEQLVSPLEALVGGCLDGLNREQFIHLVAPDGSVQGGGMASVPRRVRSSRFELGQEDNPRGAQRRGFIATAGRLQSLSATLKPQFAAYRPHDLLVSQSVDHVWVGDAVLVDPDVPHWQHLPSVSDPAAPLWVDQADASRFWYAPTFEVVVPDPAADPDNSPFLFTYTSGGMTASGKRALKATIRCTLRAVPRADTQAALLARGNPSAQAAPISALSVSLDLPFVDDRDGQTKVQTLPMNVTEERGQIIAVVDLINDWVGLAYGALSQPDFQSEPARLRAAYTLNAYVPVQPGQLNVVYGGKIALTRINYSEPPSAELTGPYLDAVSTSYHFEGGELRLMREAPRSKRLPAVAAAIRPQVFSPAAMSAAAPMAIQPAVSLSPALANTLFRTEFAIQTMIRDEHADALYPCATFGALYRETRPEGPVAIGCRDALRLGETTYRQYEEMLDLAQPFYRVHRSLQQPGQFLVVPAYYRITRYAPSEAGKAYRPILYLYSVLDAEVATNSRVVLHATLQPDVPIYARRALLAQLARYAQNPVIVYPTQIPATLEAVLSVDSGIHEQPQVVQFPDSLQVAIATDVAGARLLRTRLETDAISGSAQWTLPDGSVVASALSLELGSITGPWEHGPIEITPSATGARLSNRIEGPISVSDVLIYDSAAAGPPIPIETTLSPGGAIEVAFASATGDVVPVYTLPSAGSTTLTEVRSFIENIHTNVVFLDLIDHAQHGIQTLQVQTRMDNVDGIYSVPWTAGVGNVDILLPLTTQLDRRLLHFQVLKTLTSGQVSSTPWLDWDLAIGNVISLTWPLIQ